MGVLDDAIREHLELKRRHGVAEEEVQRQEEEALGPARRDVAHQHEGEAESAVAEAAQETALFDGEDGPAAEAPAVEVLEAEAPVTDVDAAEEAEPAAPPEPVAPEAEPTVLQEPVVEEPVVEEPVLEEPDVPALSEEPPVAGQPPVGQEPDIGSHAPEEHAPDEHPGPVEDDAADARLGDTQPHGFEALEDEQDAGLVEEEDDVLLSDPEAEDEDVLEDTPDFLQDTPEHDRLWFEQKPPRDFDFD